MQTFRSLISIVDGMQDGVLHEDRNWRHMAGIETRAGSKARIHLDGVDEGGGIYPVLGIERQRLECELVEGLISSSSVSPAVFPLP